MADVAVENRVAAATAYEELFVPALFREWAVRVADAASIRPSDRVLDVACGTGVLAREVAARVRGNGRVAGVDLGDGMLAVAARLAPAIEWRQAPAESLPHPDRSFDAVVSQFGLMFFNDRRQALAEMRRVLVPGGRLAVAVWDGLDSMPAYAAEVELLERMAGKPAGDALRAPFLLGDPARLQTLFDDAGLRGATITTGRGTARFPSLRVMVEADLRGWLPLVGIPLPEDQILRILGEAERAMGAFVTAAGDVQFDTSVHIVTWTAE